ncbi:MAG TPA: protein kinase [Streptomyces sp.]|nr:protein kinase [Streptomyces sp.]
MGTEGAGARIVAGRYRLDARLGRGGMGVVWQATDQLLGRRVAVKELPFDDTLTTEEARAQRDRTLREARAVAQLHHPHIVVVHDVVEDDERPYIVMELIDGPTLADRVATRGPVDAAEAARIGVALLSALRTAHDAGVLHRDLKPANVLLEDGTDRVVLSDFGIAQVPGATTLTESGSFVGSPEYTPPERIAGGPTGPASDLWSLGVLLCEALSGESPFHRDSLGGVLHAVVSGEFTPPAQAAPILPVVRGLLQRDPERRLEAAQAEWMLRTFWETGRVPPPTGGDTPGRGPFRGPPRGPGRLLGGRPVRAPVRVPGRAPTAGTRASAAGTVPGPDGPRRRSGRGMLVAALLIAATAGAGLSAAALLVHRGGDGDGAPKSPATGSTARPRTPTPTPPSMTTSTATSGPVTPTATVTVTQTASPATAVTVVTPVATSFTPVSSAVRDGARTAPAADGGGPWTPASGEGGPRPPAAGGSGPQPEAGGTGPGAPVAPGGGPRQPVAGDGGPDSPAGGDRGAVSTAVRDST